MPLFILMGGADGSDLMDDFTPHHHWWYATQESHGATYVVLTLSLLIRPVWPSTYEELVSLSQKKRIRSDA